MDSLQAASLTRPATPAAIGAAIAAAQDRIEQIALANIHPSPTNPRKTFEGIEELAASIAEQGLLQPIVVRPMRKDGQFEILAGARRYRALKHLKRETAPCKVMVAEDGQARALQIVENLQQWRHHGQRRDGTVVLHGYGDRIKVKNAATQREYWISAYDILQAGVR